MASSKKVVRKRLAKNIKTSLKILIVCEGPTESTYIEDLLGDIPNIEIVSIDGAGYGKFKNYIESNEKLYKVFLVVADLDKAQPDPQTRKTSNGYHLLNGLITYLHKLNNQNTIFLSNPDIEYWIACLIGQESYTEADLVSIGYRKGDSVNTFLRAHNGNFDTAVELANSDKVYYRKPKPGVNYTLQSDYLELRQSNLTELLVYIEMLNR
ncbi:MULTISPECIES: hypothetical protein [Veillonella]|jgi:hypothetical protein|uniref:hypothetical protein n=1 Tax=Veillonella TaxID=29465 RepID=UPI0029137DC3|nr:MULTISPECIES: hypothetical protein [Veillonella]MDU6865356.1 hypothetical protein [Veillonella sp.]MDU6912531.1 hypothetical protein [Veillonella sp.]MDU6948903.1 hypothetical protein [Veillonella parvula]